MKMTKLDMMKLKRMAAAVLCAGAVALCPSACSDDDDEDGVTESSEGRAAFDYLSKIRQNPAEYADALKVPSLKSLEPRPQLTWNSAVAKVAQRKAEDMLKRNYFSHVDPDGNGINIKLKEAGYEMPDSWTNSRELNYFESICYGMNSIKTYKEAVDMLIYDGGEDDKNAGHRTHLLGITDFKKNLTDIGVGMATDGTYYYWSFVIAKHNY